MKKTITYAAAMIVMAIATAIVITIIDLTATQMVIIGSLGFAATCTLLAKAFLSIRYIK